MPDCCGPVWSAGVYAGACEHSANLDEEDGSKSVAQRAQEFADLFLAACRNWGARRQLARRLALPNFSTASNALLLMSNSVKYVLTDRWRVG